MKPIIQISNLSKSYSNFQVIKNINLSVLKGEIFGLIGENGAGKSTVIECILGTKKPCEGEVFILGMNPNKQRIKLFEEIGVQFQESSYPDKIKVDELCQEISCIYQNKYDYIELLKQFNLEEKSKSFISDLSGGQKQCLFIILALIPKPKVVFLDELTTGLDVNTRRSVWENLIKLKNKGLTVFMTSHFMDEIEKLCDKIGILKNGTIIFNGTVQQAINKSPYKNLEDAYLWFLEKEGKNNE